METEVIHPHKDETYEIGYDDRCFVIVKGDRMTHISKSMIEWIVKNEKDIIAKCTPNVK